MPGVWTLREKWSLDAWDRAFDWDQAHPKDAATFLLSQDIEGNIKNLTTDALRCIGFTRLYETGRIEPSNRGEGPAGLLDINAVLSSVSDLKKYVKILKDRVDTLEKKDGVHTCSGSMMVFVEAVNGMRATLEVQPCDTIRAVKEKITVKTGMPVDQQVLLSRGRELRDNYTLADYNIHRGASIHLVLPLRGD